MTPAYALQIAIQEVIESHVKEYKLSDADVFGALAVVHATEEANLAHRFVKQVSVAQSLEPKP